MAIELIKNGAAISAAPVRTNQKQGADGKSFELTLSETKTGVTTSEAIISTDRVVLTNSFAEIRKNVDFSRESSVDMDRVERLRQAIEDGSYEINTDRIAMKMMYYAD